MEATSFPESNDTLNPPKGWSEDQCSSLSIFRHSPNESYPYPMVISCFKLTTDEIDLINKTKRVFLWVIGGTMPPVILSVTSPFTPDGDVTLPPPEPDHQARANMYESLLTALLPQVEEVAGAGYRMITPEGVDTADLIRTALAKYKV